MTHPSRSTRPRLARGRSSRRAAILAERLEDRNLMTLLGQSLFPSDNPWNQNIASAPVAANSSAIINNIIGTSSNGRLHPDFGQTTGGDAPLYGIPYNIVHGNTQPKIAVSIDTYPNESDIEPVPIPSNAVIEGDNQDGPNPARGDSHLIIWDQDNNIDYELFGATRPSENSDGRWHAAQETVWNLNTNQYRTLGETSADAAGLPILTGLARPDEGLPVSQGGQGAINHALRFTLQNKDILNQFLYPASHTANPGNNNAAIMPPMGTRFRLKASVDISGLSPESQIIAQAMKTYGLILADNGSNFFFTGASDAVDASNNQTLTWNDNDIQDSTHGLKSLHFSDFEVVNSTPIVTGLSVASAAPGTTITVVGQNFSGASGHLQVLFGSVAATQVNVVDDSHVTAVVPSGSGSVDVRVQSGVTASNSSNINNPIFGYGISATSSADQFSFAATAAPSVANAGFESPALGQGSFAYNPSGATWNFQGQSGISGNGSGFTAGNPAAPEGAQAAFLQGTGSFSQSVAGFAAGSYQVQFQAAQRVNYQASRQDFRILIDGQSVGDFVPSGTTYLLSTSNPFTVAAGAHTLTFQGLDSAGGDNTAFLDAVRVVVATTATAPSVADSGFETPVLSAGGYQYQPTSGAWTFQTGTGIAGNGSAFTSGNPTTPEGTQVAFLQQTGAFSQSVSGFAAGSYRIMLQAAQRGNFQAHSQDFQVLVDGQSVGTIAPSGTTYALYSTRSFTVSAGAHTVAFQGLNSAGGDNTVFLDAIRIVQVTTPPAPTVADSGFESPALAARSFQYQPGSTPWSYNAAAGIAGNNSAFTSSNPAAPEGTQVAFLQQAGAFQQTIAGWSAGTYRVDFRAAQRGGSSQASRQDFEVLVDGNVVAKIIPASTNYATYQSMTFQVTTGTHTLVFQGLNSAGGDNTAFVDSILIASA